jgi:DMSO reductase anchor subunit
VHPAFSVIFLTTLIGAGQGLFLALYTVQVYAAFRLLPAQDPAGYYALGSPVALLLLVAAGLATQAFSLLLAAFLAQYAGLLAERWFFFAQANHPQNLYYQTV